jgi:hypothetical protein
MPYQLGVTIRAPVISERVAELREWLAEAGRAGIAGAPFDFNLLPGVHFARLFLVPGRAGDDAASLVYMADVDGPLRRHLSDLAQVAGGGLGQVFRHCAGCPAAGPGSAWRRWLRRHLVRADAVYVNTVGRGVDQIRQEAELRAALEDYLDRPGHGWPADAPNRVRDDIRAYVAASPDLAWALRPPPRPPLWWRLREAAHLVGVPLLALPVLPALPVWALLLRHSERRDVPDAARPAAEHLQAVAPYQDRAAQNPLSAVTVLKPGLLRRLTTRAVLAFLGYASRHVYNRGRLGEMKTIHFARWALLDGHRRLLFASSYDGSLESYMDDFIDRSAAGLNAIFSNGQGYPLTRWLLLAGARYEQDFKHYLTSHQLPVPVWYSAYPELTAVNVENNARIRAGLRGEMTPEQARRWLSLL